MKKLLPILLLAVTSGTVYAQDTSMIDVRTEIIQYSRKDPKTTYTNLLTLWRYNGTDQGHFGYGSNNGSIFLHNNIGSVNIGSLATNGNIAFYTSTGQKMFISPDGNIGIGTNTPTMKLDVKGQISAGNLLYLHTNNLNSTELVLEKMNGTYYSISVNNTQMQFYNHSTKNVFMIADASDNIGIGTTNTYGHKLAVAGGILAEKVKVKLQRDWPDYVFEATYQLPALPDLERYVRMHKHLPDIPSAQEVAEKGLDVGDTQGKLLQKIEELTLLLIEQNKKLEAQEKRLKAVERRQRK
ncbi:MAG TPA: hypothetical protein VM802_15905 [Chitinophaga sp.]|uniref:hypothetical protein n=1 Tax=Chitinophaga sp. TaxID=1869181 RepID=UPI002BD8AEC9|nr:hypothetical protein [Chitinophaga sp.]HVI46359.1 hypothetical protein [Chitinophaga sp.]